ncbi:Histone-lysine N-methyltransferase SETDB1 [Holothuria leucospilota]|uniref:Histone-lysine N-methyltransferase SETDB1 n=1 Tax=Holothuria leucospilota TaxID=206669 RepID=A0A9Q0YPK5_HOLLE|nr:Histone-lysine N-methyltransferase SETDB1 [Holothuria leucospilota]
MLQNVVGKAVADFKKKISSDKLHQDYKEIAEEVKKSEENCDEIERLLETQLDEVKKLREHFEKRKNERPENGTSDPTLFASKIDESNPWSIHELYDELKGSDYHTEELIKHKKQKLNGHPSVLGREVIEMQIDEPTLFKSRIHNFNPWKLPDLYEEMGPDDSTEEVLLEKREKLKQEKLAAIRQQNTTPTTSTQPRAFSRKTTTSVTPTSAAKPTSSEETPPKPHQPVELIEIDDDSDDENQGPTVITNISCPLKGTSVLAKWKDNCWFKGTLVDIIKDQRGQQKFKVKIERERDSVQILVSGMQIASAHSAKSSELTIGQRVVALFKEEDGDDCLYAGVIAEMPMTTNHGRYLVFFDDGYVQYMHRKRIYLVYQNSKNVWDDVEELMSEFVKDYLEQYPFRPLVRVVSGSEVKTEFQGKWLRARVVEVDSSLVLMQYTNDLQKEWLYRGSTRLEPVYRFVMMHRYGQGVTPRQVQQNVKRVEYSLIKPHQYLPVSEKGRKQMARKSSGSASRVRKVQVNEEEPEIIDLEQDEPREVETVEKETEQTVSEPAKDRKEKKKFVPHSCGPNCVASSWPLEPERATNINPLKLPHVCGWTRELMKPHSTTNRKQILYKTPCGMTLRSMEDVDLYLTQTKIHYLAVDHFDFSPYVFTLTRKFKGKSNNFEIPDISHGDEPTPVMCVNEVDDSPPPVFKYVAHRKELDGNKINLDPGFLVCCDCTDNCKDKAKCACQQLTIEATKVTPPGVANPDAGYVYRRLLQSFPTGLYECNDKCKCSSQCHNRVVQNGLQLRLQVFKTEKKGWGIRCCDDIPKGSFVCVYSGHIWDDEEANLRGQQGRDQYFAELDHIEVVEKIKEGYESGVESDLSEDDDDEEETGGGTTGKKSKPPVDQDWDLSPPSDSSSDDEFIPSNVKMKKKSTNTPEPKKVTETSQSPGGTKLVLRRTSEEKSGDSWSVTFAREKAQLLQESPSKILYGYNPNPGKVLDQDQIEAFRQRQQARKQRRSKGQQPKKQLFEAKDDMSSESDSNSVVAMESGNLKSYEFASKLMEVASQYAADHNQENLIPPTMTPTTAKKGQVEAKEEKKSIAVKNGKSKEKVRPTRSYFGEEHCYIMDALEAGNLGRFFNHSCSPNLFVQNVFVDTHDLRFPWVAFFAARYLRAGTELTWDYAYEIGSVPGKELRCYCGSRYCKGRLL